MQKRVSAYQYKLMEVVYTYRQLSEMDNSYSLFFEEMSQEQKELRMDLMQQLFERLQYLAKKHLTARHFVLLQLQLAGYTQHEMAAQLKLCQSTIAKHFIGNTDYVRKDANGDNMQYGGLYRKLRIITAKDKKCILLLQQINNLQ